MGSVQKRFWGVLGGILLCSSASLGDIADSPEPEPGYFDLGRSVRSIYDAILRRHLVGPSRQLVQMIVAPSVEPEESVAIEGADATAAIVVHRRLEASLSRRYGDALFKLAQQGGTALPGIEFHVEVVEHSAHLPAELVRRVCVAWIAWLKTAHYGPFYPRGDDGTTYHFTAFVLRWGTLAGKIWEPADDTLGDHFVKIGYLLAEYADKPQSHSATMMKLDKSLRRVEQLLGLRPIAPPE